MNKNTTEVGLNEEQFREVLKVYRDHKTKHSADIIIKELQGLIGSIAKSFKNYDKYYDFVTEGVIGVLSCVKNFNFEGKTKFSSFAYFAIRGKILDSRFETSDIMNKKKLNQISFNPEDDLRTSEDLVNEVMDRQLLDRLNEKLSSYNASQKEFVLACADKGGARTAVVEKYKVSHSTVKYHANKIQNELVEYFNE